MPIGSEESQDPRVPIESADPRVSCKPRVPNTQVFPHSPLNSTIRTHARAPYSCHPHAHTPVTPILCTRIHASRVYEVHYGFRVVYLTYLNPTRYMRYTTGIRGIWVRNLGHFVCVLKFDSPLPEDHRVNILSTADSLHHHLVRWWRGSGLSDAPCLNRRHPGSPNPSSSSSSSSSTPRGICGG